MCIGLFARRILVFKFVTHVRVFECARHETPCNVTNVHMYSNVQEMYSNVQDVYLNVTGPYLNAPEVFLNVQDVYLNLPSVHLNVPERI